MTSPYDPPKTDSPSVDPSAFDSDVTPVTLPGVSRSVTVRRAGAWSGARIFVDGQPAEKAGFGKVKIPRDDGHFLTVRFQEALTGPILIAGKDKIPVGPRTPAALGLLTYLPIGLVAVGGLVGGLLGAGGMLLNRKIADSNRPTGMKVALMLAVFVGALIAAVSVATFVRLAAAD